MNDFNWAAQEGNLAEQEDVANERVADFIDGLVSRVQDYAAADVDGGGVKERLDMEEHLLAFFDDPIKSDYLKAFHADEKEFMLTLGKNDGDDESKKN